MRLGKGDFFGERALLKNEPRGANVIATGYVDCLVLERADFNQLLGPLEKVTRPTAAYYSVIILLVFCHSQTILLYSCICSVSVLGATANFCVIAVYDCSTK
jgi:Cyclic nucleotide-binding domain